jgi:hypothetical protein
MHQVDRFICKICNCKNNIRVLKRTVFKKQNKNGGMNSQKTQERTKEQKSKSLK